MPSEIAEAVAKTVTKSNYERALLHRGKIRTQSEEISEALDTELQEVREVLSALRNSHGCWCIAVEDYEFLPPFKCGERCTRTRALYQRLRVDGGKGE